MKIAVSKKMHLEKSDKRNRVTKVTAALFGEGTALLCTFLYRRIYIEQKVGMILLFSFLSVVTVIAVNDLLYRTIPDRYCMILLGISAGAFVAMPEICWLERIAGAVCIGMIMWTAVFFLPGVFGGGDLKLMVICGFFFGNQSIGEIFCFAVVIGSGYALVLLTRGKKGREGIAMAPFFALGIWIQLLKNLS